MLCFSAFMVWLGVSPEAIDGSEVNDPVAMIAVGAMMLCGSLFFVAIPFVVGFFTLREKQLSPEEMIIDIDEPIPPAI